MKRIYKTPELEVIGIRSETINQGSPTDGINVSSGSASGRSMDSRERGSRSTDNFEDIW